MRQEDSYHLLVHLPVIGSGWVWSQETQSSSVTLVLCIGGVEIQIQLLWCGISTCPALFFFFKQNFDLNCIERESDWFYWFIPLRQLQPEVGQTEEPRISFESPTCRTGAHIFEPSFVIFPAAFADKWKQSSTSDTQMGILIRNVSLANGTLAFCVTQLPTLSSSFFFFFKFAGLQTFFCWRLYV